jgi:hypothetical protein
MFSFYQILPYNDHIRITYASLLYYFTVRVLNKWDQKLYNNIVSKCCKRFTKETFRKSLQKPSKIYRFFTSNSGMNQCTVFGLLFCGGESYLNECVVLGVKISLPSNHFLVKCQRIASLNLKILLRILALNLKLGSFLQTRLYIDLALSKTR